MTNDPVAEVNHSRVEPTLYFSMPGQSVEEAFDFLRENVDPKMRAKPTASPDWLSIEFDMEPFSLLNGAVTLTFDRSSDDEIRSGLETFDSFRGLNVPLLRAYMDFKKIGDEAELAAIFAMARLLSNFGTMHLDEIEGIMMATSDLYIRSEDRSPTFFTHLK